eukprot:c7535_g1_i1.p1 GENE.c7535_g1_i1~~c7535_g1_i1.p1  ORF type:complete len:383 (+),score=109.36 c7535_g1_i1:2-1150(+)
MFRFTFVFSVIIGIGSFFVFRMLGYSKNLTYNDSRCQVFGDNVLLASVDLEVLPDGNVIISSGDLKNTVYDYSKTVPGKMALLNLSQNPPTVIHLPIQGFPPNYNFQPNGIYLSKNNRVYVVNHMGHEDAIEVLKYNSDPPSLTYLFTVSSDLFSNYVLNDVVEGNDENEIYVTRWLMFPVPIGGFHYSSFQEKFQTFIEKICLLFGIPSTRIYRCTWKDDGSHNPPTECSDGIHVLSGANGLSKIPETNTYFVADSPGGKLLILSREFDGSLKIDYTISLPHPIDNIVYNSVSHSVTVGSTPHVLNVLLKIGSLYGEVIPGGMAEVKLLKNGNLVNEFSKGFDVILHNGEKLSKVSVGVRSGDYVILGSPFTNGVLVCPQN